MQFWVIYSLSSLLASFLVSKYFSYKNQWSIFFLILVLLLTPTNLDGELGKLAPSLSVFFYDVIFLQMLSFKSLRPLILSLPSVFIILMLIRFFKKRFF